MTAAPLSRPGPLQTLRRRRRKLEGRIRNLLLRRRILSELSAVDRKALKRLRVATFPVALIPSPHYGTGIYKIEIAAGILGLRLEGWRPWGRYDLILNWQDVTRLHVDVPGHMELFRREHEVDAPIPPIINCGADISKSQVDRAHIAAFGYGSLVDPTTHHGPMVEKTDLNALHHVRMVHGPIAPEEMREGYVYARFLATGGAEGLQDIRTPYADGMGSYGVVKTFHGGVEIGGSFDAGEHSRELRPAAELFSAEEIAAVDRFLVLMGLDYGEMDILRDNADGRIHVVDANRTPTRATGEPDLAMESRIYGGIARDLLHRILLPVARGDYVPAEIRRQRIEAEAAERAAAEIRSA